VNNCCSFGPRWQFTTQIFTVVTSTAITNTRSPKVCCNWVWLYVFTCGVRFKFPEKQLPKLRHSGNTWHCTNVWLESTGGPRYMWEIGSKNIWSQVTYHSFLLSVLEIKSELNLLLKLVINTSKLSLSFKKDSIAKPSLFKVSCIIQQSTLEALG